MYYPYSRTQQSLQDISTTIRGLADLRAAERERKSQHGLILAQLGMQKSQIERQQKIGELQALSNIEEHKATQAYRQSELDIQKQRAEETARHEKKMETQGQTKIDYERDMDAPDRFENIITKSMASKGRSPKEIQDTLNHPTMIPYRGTITTKRNIDTAKDVARAYWDIEKVKRETQGKLPEMRGKLYDKKLSLQKELDFIAVGLHKRTPFPEKTDIRQNTKALIRAIQKNRIHMVVHPYRLDFPIDIEQVYKVAKEYKVLFELNLSLLRCYGDSKKLLEQIFLMLELIKSSNDKVVVTSDAHIVTEVGDDSILKRLSINLPANLVLGEVDGYQEIIEFLKRR